MSFAEETATLAAVEERIQLAVGLVRTLREENSRLTKELTAAIKAREEASNLQNDARGMIDTANAEAEQARKDAQKAVQELDDLRNERKQVRTRIEKILGQMDLLADQ